MPIGAFVIVLGTAVLLIYLTAGGGTATAAQADSSVAAAATGIVPVAASQAIQNFAAAIAFAEGYWDANEDVNLGTIPVQANNPGDLVIPGWSGGSLGEGISIFSDLQAGWNALYAQLQAIVNGTSAHYSLSESIADMGATYSGDPVNWPANVVYFLNQNFGLGVTVDTPLSGVLI
jgi:hypothetical protein